MAHPALFLFFSSTKILTVSIYGMLEFIKVVFIEAPLI